MTKWAFFVNIKLNHTSKEYRVLFDFNLKTKAKAITAADQKKRKTPWEPMRTQSKTNAGKRVLPIRDWFLIFTSDWLGEWREFSKPITKQSRTKPKQPRQGLISTLDWRRTTERDSELFPSNLLSFSNFQLSEEKQRNLVDLAEELKEKNVKLTQLNQDVEQKQEKVIELSRVAEERQANVMELYQRVKENEHEIKNLAEQSESKGEKIAELTRLVQRKEEKLADLNLEVKERKKEISELQDSVKEKDDIVAKITQKMKDREKVIAELKESIEAKDRRIQSLEKRYI